MATKRKSKKTVEEVPELDEEQVRRQAARDETTTARERFRSEYEVSGKRPAAE